jgi:hypothetical protein
METTPDSLGGRSNNSRRRDGNTKVRLESESQQKKQLRPTNSSDDGKIIDCNGPEE